MSGHTRNYAGCAALATCGLQVRCIHCHRRTRNCAGCCPPSRPTRDLRMHCQCSCKSAAFTATHARASPLQSLPPACHRLHSLPHRDAGAVDPLRHERPHTQLRWLRCTRDLRAASPLHSLPPAQVQQRRSPRTRDLRRYCTAPSKVAADPTYDGLARAVEPVALQVRCIHCH